MPTPRTREPGGQHDLGGTREGHELRPHRYDGGQVLHEGPRAREMAQTGDGQEDREADTHDVADEIHPPKANATPYHLWLLEGSDPGFLDASGRNTYDQGMKSVVSEKGQVTIPKFIRSKLGLRPGTVLEFEADRGRLIGRKAPQRDVFDELYGTLQMDESVDEFIERIRGR